LDFENLVQLAVEQADDAFFQADKCCAQAQSLLLTELNLTNYQPNPQSIAVRGFKDSFGQSGRLDAEYYQPKYEELLDKIRNYKGGHKKLAECVHLIKGIEVGAEAYQDSGIPFIRVSNLSPFSLSEEKYIDKTLYQELSAFQPKQGDILLSKDASPSIAYYLAEAPQKMIVSGGILRLQAKTKALNQESLCLILNSIIVKEQINRDVGGSVILHWRPDQVMDTLVPIIPSQLQSKISQHLAQSRQLRTTAKHLLESAKQAVEIAIAQDEARALAFLQHQSLPPA